MSGSLGGLAFLSPIPLIFFPKLRNSDSGLISITLLVVTDL